jgi:hypothetical protein
MQHLYLSTNFSQKKEKEKEKAINIVRHAELEISVPYGSRLEFSLEYLNEKFFSEFYEYCGHRLHVMSYPVCFSYFMLHLASSFTKICLSRLFLIRESTLKSKEITIERGTSGSISLKFSRVAPFRRSFIHVISVFLSRLMSWFISEHPLH